MASTSLTRTSSASATKGTLSMWVKRSKLGATQYLHHNVTSTSNNYGLIVFDANDQIEMMMATSGSHTIKRITNRKFRDTSAWYHFVFVTDVNNSTAQNRMRIYVNGVEETSFSTNDSPSGAANRFYEASASNDHVIGANSSNAGNFDGSMSHVYNIVDTVYTPSTFGSTDSTTGEWEINTSPSVTFGSQGYLILKDGNTITDQSTNSNDFTLAAGTLTNTEDCPSNNFATLSTIYQPKESGNAAMTNGNLRHGGSGDYSGCAGIGMKTGKYYWEIKIAAGGSQRNIGIVRADKIHSNTTYGFYLAQGGAGSLTTEYSAGYRASDGDFVVKSTGSQTITSASTTTTTGDIVGVAVDCDNYTIQFFKNGVSMQTLNLTSAFFDVEQLPADRTDDGTYFEYNFGNGYFGTTAISSEGTNASGIGKFEYDVPTGYTALSTKGLNE